MYSSRFAFGDEVSAASARLLACLGALGVLAVIAVKSFEVPGVEAAVEPVARPQWLAIDDPHPTFALILPEFSERPKPGYVMLRHADGGGRKDILTWGDAAGPSRLMIEIYRPGHELEPASGTTVSTADLGAVEKVQPAGTVDSKLGPLTLVDFTARRDGRRRQCLGFARVFDEPRLQIAGWYCKDNDEVIDPGPIACALDRLTLSAAVSDLKLSALFAHLDLQSRFCGPTRAKRSVRNHL